MNDMLAVHKYCGLFGLFTLAIGGLIGKFFTRDEVFVSKYIETPRGDIYKQILKVEKERSKT